MTSTHPDITVMMVDDHTLFRETLRMFLEREPGIVLVGEAASVREALAQVLHPDIVLVDLLLSDASGPEAISTLRRHFPDARLLALTMVDDVVQMLAVLAAGASGYVLKRAAGTELVIAIRRVMSGESYVDPSLGAALARRQPGEAAHGGAYDAGLTGPERRVLALIAGGYTNDEMARILHVSRRTVETHRGRIVQKLGLRTRAELVRYARREGLSSDEAS